MRSVSLKLGSPPLVVLLSGLLVGAASFGVAAADDHWPRWRGPSADGHTTDTNIPVKFGDADVAWKVDLPGEGESSPIVWGERIFLTTALEGGKQRAVLCLDRGNGKLLWQQIVPWEGQPEGLHKMNSWATPSCVTDGEHVWAFFGQAGLHCYTVDGKHVWSRDLGAFTSPWGVAACPVLVGDLLVQNADADAEACIWGIDKLTGKTVWKTDRPNNRGWSTPVPVEQDGQTILVVNSHTGVRAYDPKDGKELWFCKSFNGRGTPTVTPGNGLLYTVNGLRGDMYAIRPGGSGDVTGSHMAWHSARSGGRDLPSPIVIGKYVLVMNMGGILSCYDGIDGKALWHQRTPGNFSASPIAAGGKAYFLSEEGSVYVVEPGPELKVVAENKITAASDDIFRASPTPHQGQLLLRSNKALFCVGQRKTSP